MPRILPKAEKLPRAGAKTISVFGSSLTFYRGARFNQEPVDPVTKATGLPADDSPPRRRRPVRATHPGPDDSMTVRKRHRQYRAEHGGRHPVERAATEDRKLDTVFMERVRRANRLEHVRVPPQGERAFHLLVAELPAGDVPVVPHHTANTGASDAD